MIKSISFKNYKSFKSDNGRNWPLELAPITVLVGPNSGGKSSIVKLFGLLSQSAKHGRENSYLRFDGPDIDMGDFKTLSYRRKNNYLTIDVDFRLLYTDEGEKNYKISLKQDDTKQFITCKYPDKMYPQTNLLLDQKGDVNIIQGNPHNWMSDDVVRLLKDDLPYIKDILSWCKKRPVNNKEIRNSILRILENINTYEIDIHGLDIRARDNRELNRSMQIQDASKIFQLGVSTKDIPKHLRPYWPGPGSITKTKSRVPIMPFGLDCDALLSETKSKRNTMFKKVFEYLILQYLMVRTWEYHVEKRPELMTDADKEWGPNDTQEILLNKFNEFMSSLQKYLRSITLLAPIRPKPKRFYTLTEMESLFGRIIIYEKSRNEVSQFLTEILISLGINYRVSIQLENMSESLPDLYSINFIDDLSHIQSNYEDVGFGLSQLLPILISLYRHGKSSFPWSMVAIEQPELHLHPKAQAKLAEVFVQNINKSKRSYDHMMTLLLETHSEHLIRGLQVQVVKGKISKDDIAVYYVGKYKTSGNSYVKRLELTDTGLFEEAWPGGFFEEGFNLTAELIRYQQ